MLQYQFNPVGSGTFSVVNKNAFFWAGTPSYIEPGVSFQSPVYEIKGQNLLIQGVHFGSASVDEFYQNNLFEINGSVCYSRLNETTPSSPTTIPRGINYYITNVSSNLTVNLPASPILGDYVWYENHPPLSARFTLTISGNGNSIRRNNNSIVSSQTNIQGLFHWDGTYWNHIYAP